MKKSMLLASFFSLAALSLNVIVIISADPDKTVTRDLNWSHGTQKEPCNECYKVYVGVTEFETKIGSYEKTTDWSSDECTQHFCEWCDRSMKAVLAFAVLCCFFSFPAIFTNCCRATLDLNNRCTKYCSLIFSFLAVVCGIIAVVSFSEGCQKKVKDYSGDVISWHYGPAWIMMVTVTALKFVDMLINMMVPYLETIRI